jgi:lysine 2,3-aminomutase
MTSPRTLRTPAALVEAGLAAPERLPELEAVAARYAVAVTRPMAELVEAGCEGVALQFIPRGAELETRPEELTDPIGDHAHSPTEGLVHRYPDRVLLKLTPICAVYCRFCFRREMVGPEHGQSLSDEALDAAFAYIAGRPQIWEVILSGGDPLVLSPRRLQAVMARLAAIAHVKVVRLHTRVPAVSPERITADLVAALRCEGKAVYVALHANHAAEFTPDARAACGRLVDAGIPMLGQTVLLRGVNDDAGILESLMRAMVETRIKPYYLHHADLAPGTAHFRTTIEEGQDLVRELRARASGLCQPTYVLDIPGGYGKVPVGPEYMEATDAGAVVRSPTGVKRPYP